MLDKGIAKKYWTKECIMEAIIKPMWYSARGGVRQATDPEVRERVKLQEKRGNRDVTCYSAPQ